MTKTPPPPAQTIDGICRNCVAWVEQAPTGPRVIGSKKRGKCVMFPPTPHPILNPRTGDVVGQRNYYVSMQEDQFCLQFLPRGDVRIQSPAANDSDGN